VHVHAATGTRLGGGLPSMGSILVNRQAHRFAREDQGYSGFARIVVAQPGGEAIEIFDQRIFDLAWHNGAFRQAFEAGQVVRAGTLRELAQLFDLRLARLLAVIDAFVALAVTGRELDLSALIELLMLSGTVVTNAIVLLDRTLPARGAADGRAAARPPGVRCASASSPASCPLQQGKMGVKAPSLPPFSHVRLRAFPSTGRMLTV
jgi:hypothetical protein